MWYYTDFGIQTMFILNFCISIIFLSEIFDHILQMIPRKIYYRSRGYSRRSSNTLSVYWGSFL